MLIEALGEALIEIFIEVSMEVLVTVLVEVLIEVLEEVLVEVLIDVSIEVSVLIEVSIEVFVEVLVGALVEVLVPQPARPQNEATRSQPLQRSCIRIGDGISALSGACGALESAMLTLYKFMGTIGFRMRFRHHFH